MFGSLEWWGGALVVVVATILQTVTGFGFALVAVPLFLFFLDPHTAVLLNLMISFASHIFLTLQVKEDIIKPTVRNLYLGSLLGLLPGLYIFLTIDEGILKLIISGISVAFAGSLLMNIAPKGIKGAKAELMVGAISGSLSSSVGMPGTPIALYFNQMELPKHQFRATSALYFTLLFPSTLLLMALAGSIRLETVYLALSLFPFTFAGKNLGYRIFSRVSQQQFQKGVPMIVITAAVYVLLSQLN